MTNPIPPVQSPAAPPPPQGVSTPGGSATAVGSATTANSIRAFAGAINAGAAQPDTAVILKAQIMAVHATASPPNADIQLNGDTTNTITGVAFSDSYFPVVGDTALVLKQGTEFHLMSQLNNSNEGGTANGWIVPSLASGVTTNGNSLGAVQHRLTSHGGDLKVEWKGAIALSGSPTSILSTPVPAAYRPASDRTVIAARNNAGDNVMHIPVTFHADGTATIPAPASAVNTGSDSQSHSHGVPGTSGYSGTFGTSQSHSHNLAGTGGLGGTGQPNNTSATLSSGPLDGSVAAHDHQIGHDHPILATSGYTGTGGQNVSHQHDTQALGSDSQAHSHTTQTQAAGTTPTWVSLHGVHYYVPD